MNSPIDIVVTWVDNTLPEWQQEYLYWKKIEIERGTQKPNHGDAFSETRYRSWNVFKYWFRGVAENCPWVNKVFLIVENKKHVPDWLDQNCEKLRIVEHKEFIPEGLLPLFNGPVIDLWYSRIPDLSDNSIICDDDFYFMNPVPDNFFFDNDVPKGPIYTEPFKQNPDLTFTPKINFFLTTWMRTRYNSAECACRYSGVKGYMLTYSHLPEARKKSFEQKWMVDMYDELYEKSAVSHFRHDDNILGNVFLDLPKLLGLTQNNPDFMINSKYLPLVPSKSADIVNAILSKKYMLVCLNDTAAEHPELLNLLVIKVFEEKFPNKCYFER